MWREFLASGKFVDQCTQKRGCHPRCGLDYKKHIPKIADRRLQDRQAARALGRYFASPPTLASDSILSSIPDKKML
jgi:hypothetical protein